MNATVVKTVREIEDLGIRQMHTFFKERLENNKKGIDEPVKKNKLPLFSTQNTAHSQSISNNEKKELKNDIKIFAKLYISTQVRGGDMDELFSNETRKYPPALAKNGDMRPGKKADLLYCLKNIVVASGIMPEVSGEVLDGAMIVNIIKPTSENNFKSYADKLIVPFIKQELGKYKRVDVIFDTYKKDSLKSSTCMQRGKGIRRIVEAKSQPPKNWTTFLRNNDNKTELFRFLAEEIITSVSIDDKTVMCTLNENVVSSRERDIILVSPSSHEEADTHIFLHVRDMALKGIKKVKIRTVDTDVLIIAIALFANLEVGELWIDFGTGKHREHF